MTSGFDYSLIERNYKLDNLPNYPKSKFLKTGTTICGLICENGKSVVVACDSRATAGPIVAQKDCMKLHVLAPNIYCGGAGTAADLECQTDLIRTKLNLHRYSSGRLPLVKCSVTMLKRQLFPYGGHIGCYLVVGGVDHTGAHLYSVYADGSTDEQYYYSLGSGSIAATSMLETYWKPGLTKEEGINLARQAILGGIYNDLGSGNRCNVVVITSEGVEKHLATDIVSTRKFKNPDFNGFPKNIEIIKKEFHKKD